MDIFNMDLVYLVVLTLNDSVKKCNCHQLYNIFEANLAIHINIVYTNIGWQSTNFTSYTLAQIKVKTFNKVIYYNAHEYYKNVIVKI